MNPSEEQTMLLTEIGSGLERLAELRNTTPVIEALAYAAAHFYLQKDEQHVNAVMSIIDGLVT